LPNGSVIIRKGSVRVNPGDLNVIPSSMADDIVLVRATDMVQNSLFSLSHGTGRTMSRGDSKSLARDYDWDGLFDKVMIPDLVSKASLTTEGPFAYRGMDDCLALLDGYVDVVERFKVVGYIGHL
jgi:RNA-splicing ligase RtcB